MKDNQSPLLTELSVNVSQSAFFGTVALFFTGILVSQFHSFRPSIKFSILFLVISTFSFIFSAAIYVNGAGELARHNSQKAVQYILVANQISEFLGLYLFVLAIPLALNAITNDSFLRFSVDTTALVGITLYSLSPFSVLSKETDGNLHIVISLMISVISLAMLMWQTTDDPNLSWVASLLIACLIAMTVIFVRRAWRPAR